MDSKLPYIEISGSNNAIGSAIGEHLRDVIKEAVETRHQEVPDYAAHLEKSGEYYRFTKSIFPSLIDESNAIAKAACVSELDYFFMNNREVYDPAEAYDLKDSVNPDHCTIAVSFGPNGAVVGHNEDWHESALRQLYILKATIKNTTFVGVNYATSVPGVSATMNSYGLIQCINELNQTSQFGVPKNFLARAVLECKTLDEAHALIQNTKKASGFNHVLVQGDQVLNIEIAGDQIAVQKVTDQPYVHTNHYLSDALKSLEKFHTASSEARFERASELVKPGMDAKAMMRLLSDTHNSQYPICRERDTIASLVFEPAKRQVHICRGHPCQGTFYPYNI